MPDSFGTTTKGDNVERHTLTDGAGLEVDILTYGATIAAIRAPDRAGERRNVVLGFADLYSYERASGRLGAIVGRYGNRIARGRFTLDGSIYRLTANDFPNTLHGGGIGYDKRVWAVTEADGQGLTLALESRDGDQGFPGALSVTVRYSLSAGALTLAYTARTSKPTVLNLTNHAYFNLAGEDSPDILGHEVEIPADRLVAIDGQGIPTGELMPVAGTPLDFTRPRLIGERIREPHPQIVHGKGYDHCYVLGEAPSPTLQLAARVRDRASGRTLTVETTEPGVQFYTGNSLDSTLVGAGGKVYRQSAGLALETQHFPDSPNQPSFPSTMLRPGDIFTSTTRLTFATSG